jgi:endonuclease/exonuclease/phosphatase (EEP) superfamily protein YafD
MPIRLTRVVDVATWLAVGGCGFVLSMQMMGESLNRWVTSLQALTAWVMLVALTAAVVAGARRRIVQLLVAMIVAVGYLVLTAPLVFPTDLPTATTGEGLRVASANVLYSNQQPDAVIETLLALDADVIAISELTPPMDAMIADSELPDRYPYHDARPGSSALGIGVWSRRPLLDVPEIDGTQMTLTTGLELDGRLLRLVATHPIPPLFHADEWRAEMDALAAGGADAWAESVLVGDLNVSYFHPPFRSWIDELELRDVHTATGDGFSVSWPTDEWLPPFVRLDHALVGEGITATAIEDFDVPGGDHHGFVVTLGRATTD